MTDRALTRGEVCCPSCGRALGPTLAGLTERQAAAVDAIDEYYRQKGCAPSYSELLAVLGVLSPASVHRQIHRLVARGWVTARPGGRRSVALTEAAKAVLAERRRA